MIGHISNPEAIPTHKHHASITFQEVIPRDKSFATHRVNFSSNCVSDQTKMNLTNVREVFVHSRLREKKSFSFYTGVMVLEKLQKYRCHRRIAALLEWPWKNQVFS